MSILIYVYIVEELYVLTTGVIKNSSVHRKQFFVIVYDNASTDGQEFSIHD